MNYFQSTLPPQYLWLDQNLKCLIWQKEYWQKGKQKITPRNLLKIQFFIHFPRFNEIKWLHVKSIFQLTCILLYRMQLCLRIKKDTHINAQTKKKIYQDISYIELFTPEIPASISEQAKLKSATSIFWGVAPSHSRSPTSKSGKPSCK